MVKPDGVIVVRGNDLDQFFRQWVIMLTPFHGLSEKMADVFARMLRWRYERGLVLVDDSEVDAWFFRSDTKKAFRAEAGLSFAYFGVMLKRFRDCGVIEGERFNLRYVPRVDMSNGRFDLLIRFEL